MTALFLDKSTPSVWKAALAFSSSVTSEATARGLTPAETELIKVRASQMNGCAFCLDLHARQAREAGVPQQQLDLLSTWRETDRFSQREIALLLIAEAASELPPTDASRADLEDARTVLGDEAFVAAEWVAIAINTFNRISILSEHPVRARDHEGKVIP